MGDAYPDYVSDELRRAVSADDASLGFLFEQGESKVFVATAVSGRNPEWQKAGASANLILIDGTFWSDNELSETGRSKKSAREIGHLPLSGADGLLAQYPKGAAGRKILVHINNTNPILDEESAERRAVLEAGFEIAYDGMTIEL